MDPIRETDDDEVLAAQQTTTEDYESEDLSDEPEDTNPQEELARMASLSLLAKRSNEGSPSQSSPVSPLVRRARKLLFRVLRVGVDDGRVFVGKFHCLDKQGNIILYDTVEYRPIAARSFGTTSAGADEMEQRSLGLVLIPSRCRTSCFVESSLTEQFTLLAV